MIRIETSAEFEKLLDSVAADALTASNHWMLFRDLQKATTRFEREMNESRAFWSLTITAHRDVVLFRLGRLYDQHKGALSLRTWLGTIQRNLNLFDQESFRERLKDNPFVDSLSQTARRPDAKVLSADLASVSNASDVLVAKICDLRNKILSHRDPRVILRPSALNVGVSAEEIEGLLNRAILLVNRYSSLFRARSYSTTMIGADDYQSTLRFVERGIDAYEAAIEAEIALASGSSK